MVRSQVLRSRPIELGSISSRRSPRSSISRSIEIFPTSKTSSGTLNLFSSTQLSKSSVFSTGWGPVSDISWSRSKTGSISSSSNTSSMKMEKRRRRRKKREMSPIRPNSAKTYRKTTQRPPKRSLQTLLLSSMRSTIQKVASPISSPTSFFPSLEK